MLDPLETRIAALYRQQADTLGQPRLAAINQFDGGPVPKFYLLRSASGCLWRARADLSNTRAAKLAGLVGEEAQVAADPRAWQRHYPQQQANYIAALATKGYRTQTFAGPVFRFSSPLTQSSAVSTVEIRQQNQRLLRRHLADWIPDVTYRRPMMGAVVDGCVVAVCASVRISDAVHEAGVATANAYRRQGFATAVVSAWATQVQRLGATPYYSTQWSNTASQRVAATLGLTWVANEFHLI